ncbi:MAG: YiiD C-terminal domain-containing protein [Microbispora sp.]|nr:YiiD C-terminal domain-containing protein [Microbispora sp.]
MDIGAFLLDSVPFARLLGITFDSIGSGTAVARLADREDLHNHVGGPHAGALFTLAETASGAAMLSAFGDQLSRAVPLATEAKIRYVKFAKGEVTATATLRADREAVVARLDAGERPEFEVAVEIRNAEGVVVSEMTVSWTLRPNRRG